jgi:putative Mg2+ transporter-C (MgtC) family protein
MKNRPAGFITHILVCVGATVVSLIQEELVLNSMATIQAQPALGQALKVDHGRVVAQAVTGIGFLGAGTIIFDQGTIKGLTTATTIWLVACLGLAIGLGFYRIGFYSAIGVVFIMIVLKKFEKRIFSNRAQRSLAIVFQDPEGNYLEQLTSYFYDSDVRITNIRSIQTLEDGNIEVVISLDFGISHNYEGVLKQMAKSHHIVHFHSLPTTG